MNNLKKFRILTNKTQSELSKDTGIPQTTYSYYEAGKTTPDATTLKKLADYFHTTIDALLGHEVPYLIDKSTLTAKQRNIIDLIPFMSDRICEKAEAYISGLIEGEKEQQALIQRLKN